MQFRLSVLLFFICVLLVQQPGFSQESPSIDDSLAVISGDVVKDTLVYKSPKGAMLRSLALPGWGQFYNGKWFKGLVIGGTEVGLIANAIIQNQLVQESTYLYDKEFYRENRSLSIWWLGGVILYSVADAFVDAHLSDFDDDPLVTMRVEQDKSFDLQKRSIYMLSVNIPF